LLMQPIHLAIGIVEGLVTSSIVIFVWKSRPEIIEKASINESIGNISMKKVLTGLIAGILIVGGFLSWFASSNPDGLEWSMFKTSGQEELDSSSKVNDTLSIVQEKTAILPDYGFKENKNSDENIEELTESWPVVNAGTSFSGIIGGTITLLLIVLIGFTIRFIKNKKIHLKN
ncbi:MAG: PDGLE domain-containing protein, partial [Clostridiales bacterium]